FMSEVLLEDNKKLEIDFMFNQQGATPNSLLAKDIDVELDTDGYIKVDIEQRTNIPYVYAAGDVTKLFSHQIVTAAHEGSMAGQSANYDLYEPEQKI
ncbi:MAG TPA: FAD-dependent oxidoreductase, partial [Candidatus Nitrosocosmicus sp.]|nr:FAD-dependent oxidoreductase [Candidatus Nitrosocosmicus sp.]